MKTLPHCTVLLPLVLLIMLSGCASFQSTEKKIPELNDDSTSPLVKSLDLMICKMTVSNAPLSVDRQVSRPSATGCLNGVTLLVAPAPGACLTSGFGRRTGGLHNGIDMQSKPAGDVVAAGSGEVILSEFRKKDYGNWIVIDHGSNVYTSYAHLASVDPSISKGAQITQGQTLGVMGQSGHAATAVHLHYEIRQGKFLNNNYFGLTPIDPFTLSSSCPARLQRRTAVDRR